MHTLEETFRASVESPVPAAWQTGRALLAHGGRASGGSVVIYICVSVALVMFAGERYSDSIADSWMQTLSAAPTTCCT